MRSGLVSIVILLAFCCPCMAVDTGYPDAAAVANYALQKNNPVVNTATAATLQTLLNSQVSSFLAQTRWAPYYEWFNYRGSSASMTEPADVFYALSLAYPYLSTSLKEQVRIYLRLRWSEAGAQPYSNLDYASVSAGTKRNWQQVNSNDYTLAFEYPYYGNPANTFSDLTRIIQLYPIYLFAQNTDSWDLVGAQYTAILNVFNSIPTTWSNRDDANVSRNISSIIGFARIADKLGYAANYATALTRLSAVLNIKIDNQRLEGTDCLNTMNSNPGGQTNANGCLYRHDEIVDDSLHDEMIAQYYGMTPELGRVLRDWATTASDNIANWIYRNAQGFYLINHDTPVYEGEVPKAQYISYMAYFSILSYIQATNFETHEQMIDVPACQADVYFIERLVRAIEASGPQNWVSYSLPMNGWQGRRIDPTIRGNVIHLF